MTEADSQVINQKWCCLDVIGEGAGGVKNDNQASNSEVRRRKVGLEGEMMSLVHIN